MMKIAGGGVERWKGGVRGEGGVAETEKGVG